MLTAKQSETERTGYYEGQKVSYEIIDGKAVIDKCLQVELDEVLDQPDEENPLSFGLVEANKLWPGGIVHYEVVEAYYPDRIQAAIAEWNEKTILQLVPKTGTQYHVRFMKHAEKCFVDYIGYHGLTTGKQHIYMAASYPTGTVMHEIGHCVSLHHEQYRTESSQYLQVQQISEGTAVGYYDFESVMHYRETAKYADDQDLIGQRIRLSPGDIQTIWEIYKDEVALLRVPMNTLNAQGQTPIVSRHSSLNALCVDLTLASDAEDQGRCLVFNGETSRIVVNNAACPSKFTLSAWVKRASDMSGGYVTILEFGNDSPFFGFSSNAVGIYPGCFADTALDTNWNHVAATYDGSQCCIYVNGELVKQVAGTIPCSGVGMGIGKHDGDTYFKGRMAEVVVLPKALSKFAVKRLMMNTCMSMNNSEALWDCATWRASENMFYFFKGREFLKAQGDKAFVGKFTIQGNWSGWPQGFVADAVLGLSDREVFFSGNQCFERKIGGPVEWGPGNIRDKWAQWPDGFWPINDAVQMSDGRLLFFKGEEVVCLDATTGNLKYRQKIIEEFKNWPSNFMPIDAAVSVATEKKAYFFKDRRYLCVEMTTNNVVTVPTPEIVDDWSVLIRPST